MNAKGDKWIDAGSASDLAIGAVSAAQHNDTKLAIWRGEDGELRALEAKCAHAGMDMTQGGKVHGNWIECPFHTWRWDEFGSLREIPYSKKPIKQQPPPACPRWTVIEEGGRIFVCETRNG